MRRAEGYSWLQILIHWLTAGLIAFQLLVNQQIERDFDNRMDGDGVEPSLLGYVHIAVGISILALGVLRLVVRYRTGVPLPNSDVPKIFVWAANVTHAALYGLLLAMPLTGLLAWFGHSDLAAELHELGKTLLILLLVAHIVGGFFEEFVLVNPSIQRITGGRMPRRK
jgi:cytochrome b561